MLKLNGEILIGDMMFLNDADRETFCSELTKEAREIVEDEYYTNIENFSHVINDARWNFEYEKMNDLVYIMRIYKNC